MDVTGPGFPFPQHERMKSPAEFKAVYDHRRSVSDRDLNLIVYGMPNGLPHNRLGLSVAKRVYQRANRRNRIKRLLREAYRLTRHELPPGMDLVVVPRCKPVPALDTLRDALRRLVPQLAKRLAKEAARRPEGP